MAIASIIKAYQFSNHLFLLVVFGIFDSLFKPVNYLVYAVAIHSSTLPHNFLYLSIFLDNIGVQSPRRLSVVAIAFLCIVKIFYFLLCYVVIEVASRRCHDVFIFCLIDSFRQYFRIEYYRQDSVLIVIDILMFFFREETSNTLYKTRKIIPAALW